MSALHPYDVSVHLVVPTTDSNIALGNFMTSLTLITATNQTLSSVRRPVSVLRRSPGGTQLMLTLQAIVLPARPPFLLSFSSKPDTLTLQVPLLYSYIARTGPIEARVELGRQDG